MLLWTIFDELAQKSKPFIVEWLLKPSSKGKELWGMTTQIIRPSSFHRKVMISAGTVQQFSCFVVPFGHKGLDSADIYAKEYSLIMPRSITFPGVRNLPDEN
jgi:hypothetical protein